MTTTIAAPLCRSCAAAVLDPPAGVRDDGRMRTLHLLRHAKSSWDDPRLADHDRPRAPRGVRAAGRMAEHLRAAAIVPDLVVCSSAVRTTQTLALLGDAVPAGCEVRVERGLYHASARALLDRCRALDDTVASVLLIGHNPGFQQVALLMTAPGAHRAAVARKFPTAALATVALPVAHWSQTAPGVGQIVDVVRPRDVGG